MTDKPKPGLSTRLLHPLVRASREFQSLATPIYRGSTVLFDSMAEVGEDRRSDTQYRYGLHGTPTWPRGSRTPKAPRWSSCCQAG